eukprot:GILJ01008409.1.p1 GENE.GILJ01008409.1~~GILJ01008409.1.p1  ORF type:complete len:337 (-),score=30.45 GILJ01008409.1:214-1224(-)
MKLGDSDIIILDGGLATELESRGADLKHHLWSAKLLYENPDLIRQVHEDYYRAGADVAITASYQASIQGFAQAEIPEETAKDLLRRSVHLARAARDAVQTDVTRSLYVAGSVGSYGAVLHDGSEYRGDFVLSLAELIDLHRERYAILWDAGVDILACETIPCLREAEALLLLAREFPSSRLWISCSCRDGTHLSSGETMAELAQLIKRLDINKQVVAFGVNCTSPAYVQGLLLASQGDSDGRALVCYPNSGEEYDAVSCQWRSEGVGQQAAAEEFARYGRLFYEAGARWFGGCCRTTPAHIRALRAAVYAQAQAQAESDRTRKSMPVMSGNVNQLS